MTTDSKPGGSRAATAPEPGSSSTPEPSFRKRASSDLRRWGAIGTGVGIEIRNNDLRVTIVKVRPSETGVLGSATVPDFRNRPSGEWGTELGAFLKKTGVSHIAATVLLPRTEVIVRQIFLPGVADKDLGSAIQLQIDSLHPFAEEDVHFSWARIGKTPFVLVGIARRETIDRYSSLFAEAGLKIAGFTFSAAVLYSASRLITAPPDAFVAAHESDGVVEVYGESEARPIYSAALPLDSRRALGVARSELRVDPEFPVLPLAAMLPKPSLFPPNHDPKSGGLEDHALPYATALAGACPWLSIESNLLPADRRRASSRVRLIPTIVLATALVGLVTALALQSSWADSRYLGVLQHEIAKYEPRAKRVEALDKAIATARVRSRSLDDFRRRAKLDMDALAEITRTIPPPGWVSSFEMDRNTVQIGGEAEQAATLLSAMDKSPLFDRSEFTMPISRSQTGEMFRIRSQRTEPPIAQPPAAQTPAPAAGASPVAAPVKNGGSK